jgi:hypothetical protein
MCGCAVVYHRPMGRLVSFSTACRSWCKEEDFLNEHWRKCVGEYRLNLTQNREQWQAFVKMEMGLQVPYDREFIDLSNY